MSKWSNRAKRILKSELVKRGISNSALANKLNELGLSETKSSIDSKISRGTFSASFLLQCLEAIGCHKIEIEDYVVESPKVLMVAEGHSNYKKLQNE